MGFSPKDSEIPPGLGDFFQHSEGIGLGFPWDLVLVLVAITGVFYLKAGSPLSPLENFLSPLSLQLLPHDYHLIVFPDFCLGI